MTRATAPDYAPEEIAARNAAAAAASSTVRGRANTTAQRPTAEINHFMWYGQSEWQGWQSAPPLTLSQRHDCLMFGQAPRPRALAGNDKEVSQYEPVGDGDFHPLLSVAQNIKTGAILAPALGGITDAKGVIFTPAPPMLDFSAATGAEIHFEDGIAITTPFGGPDHPPIDLTRRYTLKMQLVLDQLVGSWSWLRHHEFWVRGVTPTTLTLSPPLPAGTPATTPDGLRVHIISSSLDILGEEPGVGALTHLRGLQLARSGPDNRQLLLTNSCIGGVSISTLSKPSKARLYNRLTDAAGKVHAKAASLGKTSVIPAVAFAQGGTDCAQKTSYDSYRASTLALVADIRADLMAITGQAAPPLFLTFQVSGPNLSGNDDGAVPMAQLELALNPPDPDWAMIGPFYFVTDQPQPYHGVHWTGNGERWAGQMTGKILHKILDLNEGWLPLHPTRITCRNRTILIDFHVPEPPLQFQPVCIGTTRKMFVDRGFTITDATGPNQIKTVKIVADRVLRIICVRPFAGEVTVHYGASRHHGGGNLCDSDRAIASETYLYTPFAGQRPPEKIPALVGRPYPLWNWCVVFKRSIPADPPDP